MTKTMTLWGAYAKLEAIAAAAERAALPGRVQIRERVESILCRSHLDKTTLELHVMDWRAALGSHEPKTAAYLDDALYALLDYLDGEEVHLTGAELLDQLIDGQAAADLEDDITRAMHRQHAASIR